MSDMSLRLTLKLLLNWVDATRFESWQKPRDAFGNVRKRIVGIWRDSNEFANVSKFYNKMKVGLDC
jgi:hypothetical protein